MPPAIQQWDPYAVLVIVRSRTRCYGWAPSKNRDCHNTVAEENRLEAQRLLARLSRRSPGSADVSSELNKIARCLLCRNSICRHQDQARSVVGEWRDKIRDFVQSAVEPRDDDEHTEADEATGGEHTVDVREQMAECQRLLTRVATALESHQEAQRHFETFSVGSDSSTDTIRAQSTVESETPRSETVRDDREEEHATEPPATELNLEHVQTLVRRLTLEHETSRLRRSRTVRSEEDESPRSAVGSAASSTVSSQTLSGNPGSGPQVSEHDQRVEAHPESPAILPEVEERNNTSHGQSSSETTTSMTTGLTETEYDQPENDNEPLTSANLSPWSAGLAHVRSTFFGRNESNGACDEGWNQRRPHSSRRYSNPMWLAAVALYLGMLFAWYRFQVLQTSGPRRLTLDGPMTQQIGAMAAQSDVGGPILSSLAIIRH